MASSTGAVWVLLTHAILFKIKLSKQKMGNQPTNPMHESKQQTPFITHLYPWWNQKYKDASFAFKTWNAKDVYEMDTEMLKVLSSIVLAKSKITERWVADQFALHLNNSYWTQYSLDL